jgi:phosphoenolpyruvate-protein phosphotransferase (PTS system enzyme I)
MLRGTGVSAGVARGTAFVIAGGCGSCAALRSIQASEVDGERARFEAALDRASSELAALQLDVTERIGRGQADIFGAQALVVRDPSLREQVLLVVREKRVNVEAALTEVIERYTRSLDDIPDTYLRERAADVRDVGRRVLSALAEWQGPDGLDIPENAIVVADELLPSATARLELNRARAFVTERGSKFSHSSILARSLGTPAVAGILDASSRIKTGDRLIVDGLAGVVFVNPEGAVQREYERLEAELQAYKEGLRHLVDVPSVTLDGTTIPLLANVNKFADTEAALLYNADGIGLYRTEFQFSIRAAPPTEEEQYEFLERAAERLRPRKVVLRLLDLGGDKILPYLPLPVSRNPSLSQRGIGLLLQHLDVLKPQLRAFLRVSADHPVSILLPVVRGLEDVRQAREVVRQVQAELASEGKRFDPSIAIGAMVEVPSAALITHALAREVDFLSLGTNDLVQYVLAADREDESSATSYQPLHPAVLRLIQSVAEAAESAGCELTICGEMAGDPALTELLLGLGLRALSVAPGEMLEVKSAIRRTRLDGARNLARGALELGSVAEIEALLNERRTTGERDTNDRLEGAFAQPQIGSDPRARGADEGR